MRMEQVQKLHDWTYTRNSYPAKQNSSLARALKQATQIQITQTQTSSPMKTSAIVSTFFKQHQKVLLQKESTNRQKPSLLMILVQNVEEVFALSVFLKWLVLQIRAPSTQNINTFEDFVVFVYFVLCSVCLLFSR